MPVLTIKMLIFLYQQITSLCAFFRVIPWRLNFICQHFRTVCLFHLHRRIGVKNNWGWECSGIYTGKGYTVAQLVKALCYKPEGYGFDSQWCTGIFHLHNPSGRTMAKGLTQPLTEMTTRNISWGGKGGRCVQPYHFHVLTVLKSGSLNLLEPSWPAQACSEIALPLFLPYMGKCLARK